MSLRSAQNPAAFAALCAPFLGLSLTACIGTMEEKFQQRQSDASPFADADPFAPDADVPDCTELVTAPGDGYHFPGEDCVSCHRQAGGAPPFTVGGTVYSDVDGSAPIAGATIVIDDASGTRYSVVTEANGNFYSTEPITFPVKTYITVCPDVIPMVTNVPQTSASCNSGSCHSAGFRVFLPQ